VVARVKLPHDRFYYAYNSWGLNTDSSPNNLWGAMRDALTRHQQWCAAEDLTGPAYDQQRAHLAADAAAELDRVDQARGRDASDAA